MCNHGYVRKTHHSFLPSRDHSTREAGLGKLNSPSLSLQLKGVLYYCKTIWLANFRWHEQPWILRCFIYRACMQINTTCSGYFSHFLLRDIWNILEVCRGKDTGEWIIWASIPRSRFRDVHSWLRGSGSWRERWSLSRRQSIYDQLGRSAHKNRADHHWRRSAMVHRTCARNESSDVAQ